MATTGGAQASAGRSAVGRSPRPGSFAAARVRLRFPDHRGGALIEATGLDRKNRLPLVLLPGLHRRRNRLPDLDRLGSITGLNTSYYAIGALTHLPTYNHPTSSTSPGRSRWRSLVADRHLSPDPAGGWGPAHVMPPPSLPPPPLRRADRGRRAWPRLRAGPPTTALTEVLFFRPERQLPGLVSEAGSWSIVALALADRVQGAWLRRLARPSAAARHFPPSSSARPRAHRSHLPGFARRRSESGLAPRSSRSCAYH